jgi:hypothetical protein
VTPTRVALCSRSVRRRSHNAAAFGISIVSNDAPLSRCLGDRSHNAAAVWSLESLERCPIQPALKLVREEQAPSCSGKTAVRDHPSTGALVNGPN